MLIYMFNINFNSLVIILRIDATCLGLAQHLSNVIDEFLKKKMLLQIN